MFTIIVNGVLSLYSKGQRDAWFYYFNLKSLIFMLSASKAQYLSTYFANLNANSTGKGSHNLSFFLSSCG